MESHLEARLWNDIFVATQKELGIPQGTVKATVLIETIVAAFEMDEILYELREHSAGLNAGRWDYIFSCIKKFKVDRSFCLADRAKVTMTAPFMARLRAAAAEDLPPAQRAGDRRHERADPDQERSGEERDGAGRRAGGQSTATPPTATTAAGWRIGAGADRDGGVRQGARREAEPDRQAARRRAGRAGEPADFQPEAPITEAGLRMNINVGIHYLGSWLAGNGCVPNPRPDGGRRHAEISRSQVWQWIRSPKGLLDDGRKVSAEMVRALIAEELAKVKAAVGGDTRTYDRAAQIFEQMSTQESFAEFPDAAAVRRDRVDAPIGAIGAGRRQPPRFRLYGASRFGAAGTGRAAAAGGRAGADVEVVGRVVLMPMRCMTAIERLLDVAVNETISARAGQREAVGQRQARRLGGIAAAPGVEGEAPADLGAWREVGVERRHRQPGEADAAAVDLHCPVAQPAHRWRPACADHGRALFRRKQLREVLHHPRVGVQCGERVEVVGAPRTQHDARSMQHGHSSSPTSAAVRQVDSKPASTDFMPSSASSARRCCGSSASRPPSMMPRLPKLAKPHSA